MGGKRSTGEQSLLVPEWSQSWSWAVWPQAEPCPSSTGTVATARPSRTQTRRRCTIRMGRVSAAPQGSEGKEGEVMVGTSAGLGVAQVGRRKVPTEKTRAPERDSRVSQRSPKAQCYSPFLGHRSHGRCWRPSPGKCTDVCTRTQFCI